MRYNSNFTVLFVGETQALFAIDITNLNKISIIKKYNFGGVTDIQINKASTLMFVTVAAKKGISPYGFTIFNITDPYFISIASSVPTSGSRTVKISSDETYCVVGDVNGAVIFEVTNPYSIGVMQVAQLKKGTSVANFVQTDTLVRVAASDSTGAYYWNFNNVTYFLYVDTPVLYLGTTVPV